jgi:hypothetical protein
VKLFFQKRGYNITKIFSTRRAIVAFGKKDNKKYFLKFPKNEEISRTSKNDYVWCSKLHQKSIKNKWPVYIPKIHEKGIYNNLFWFAIDYFETKDALSDPDKKYIKSDFIKKDLNKTIDFLFILPKVRVKLLTDTDKQFYFYKCRYKKNIKPFIKWSIRYASKQIKYNNKDVMKIIDNTKFEGVELAHTDYKPWHMFRYKGKIALIDSENTNNLTPKYYDIASYYARIVDILNREDIANVIIKKFYKRVPNQDKDSFMEQFRALVSWISVGELRDATLKKTLCPGNKRIFKIIKENSFLD